MLIYIVMCFTHSTFNVLLQFVFLAVADVVAVGEDVAVVAQVVIHKPLTLCVSLLMQHVMHLKPQ